MDRKYKITSSSHIITMMVNFEDNTGNSHTMSVGVDYYMNKVYFLDKTNDSIDYENLESEILASLRPEEVFVPEIPIELMNRVKEVREGKYDNEYFYKKDTYGK
jgi:hypothetical protein